MKHWKEQGKVKKSTRQCISILQVIVIQVERGGREEGVV